MRIQTATALLSLSLTGCAFLHSKTVSNPKTGEVTTTVTAYSLWDAQGNLTKFQNRGVTTSSNEWAPGTSIAALSQSAQSTNINDLVGSAVGAAVKAGIMSVKP